MCGLLFDHIKMISEMVSWMERRGYEEKWLIWLELYIDWLLVILHIKILDWIHKMALDNQMK